jgi:Tfp pilus assembly PilM family ATPase/Tfp pilus assembly protein PilN
MIKRSIGIEISANQLCAVQMSRSAGHFSIEKIHVAPMRRASDLPVDIIKSLFTQRGFNKKADVAISMSNDAVFFRNVETDLAGLEQIRRSLVTAQNNSLTQTPSFLEHNFPIKPEELAVQICSSHPLQNGKYSALVAAVAKTSLQERLDILANAKAHGALVEAPIFAVYATAIINHPELMTNNAVVVFIGQSHLTLAVAKEGKVQIVQNVPITSCSDNALTELLSREVRAIWQKVFTAEISRDAHVYIAAARCFSDEFKVMISQSINSGIIFMNLASNITGASKYKTPPAVCVAQGLALRLLAPDKTSGINFLETASPSQPMHSVKNELMTCAVLVLVIGIVWLTNLFLRLAHLETAHAQITSEMKSVFNRALPHEKNIVNASAQMQQKLDSLRADYTNITSAGAGEVETLKIFQIIANSIPQDVITLDEMLIATESVRLSGAAQSFEAVYNWQRTLQNIPNFSSVDVQGIQKQTQNKSVRFTISISLEATQ